MNIVIVGDGKVGATLVEHLSMEGHNVVVIDRDQKIVEQMVNSYDVMGICGNGANCELQLEAGVDTSDLFVAATSSDELNILSCLMAKKAGAKHTIATYFGKVTYHCTELFKTCFNFFITVFNGDEGFVALYIGCNRPCTKV